MLYTKRCDAYVYEEVAEDVTLPDYFPEIRRIVSVRSSAHTNGKYLSDGELECDGDVIYTVLYTSAEGELCHISHTSSFTGHIPMKTEGDIFTPNDVVLSCQSEGASCRVSSPRKITLSSRVKLCAISSVSESLNISCTDGSELRKKTEIVRSVGMVESVHEGEVSGSLRERDGSTLISAVGEICVSETRAAVSETMLSDSRIRFKGEAYLTLLLRDSDGVCYTTRTRESITHDAPLPTGYSKDASCAVFPEVTLTEVKMSEDGEIEWRMEYLLVFDCMDESESEVVCDAYIPTAASEEISRRDIGLMTAVGASSGRLTVNSRLGLTDGGKVIFSCGSGEIDSVEARDGKLYAEGKLKMCCITEKDGEYSAVEGTFPLKYECGGGFSSSACAMKGSVRVCDVSAREDGGEVSLTSEVSISLFALAEKTVSAVSSVTAANDTSGETKSESMIRVYIPDCDEGEWEVEKKFRLGHEARITNGVYVI